MKTLVAGQNIGLAQRELTFSFDGPGEVAVLLLDEQRHARSPDHFVTASHRGQSAAITVRDTGSVDVSIQALPDGVHYVACLVTGAAPHGGLTCRLSSASDNVVFEVNRADVHPAMICLEIYRRHDLWKVRAVGQGYAGGLAQLLRAHGIANVTQPDSPPPAPALTESEGSGSPSIVPPLGDADPLERISMIHEDAARSTAAFIASSDFAVSRLDAEMSAAVADPATRNSASAQQAIATAQRRHDDLVARAQADYDRDATHLIAELAALDTELPAALAPWYAPAWRKGGRAPSPGIRLGSVMSERLNDVRVPFGTAAPLRRPLWIDAGEAKAATEVAAAVVMRLLAATPQLSPTVEIIDVGAAMRPLWQPLSAHMPQSVVTEPGDVAPRLRQLAHDADVQALRRQAEQVMPAAKVLVLADFGFGISAAALHDVVTLINKAVEINLSIVFIGDSNWNTTELPQMMRDIIEYSSHIPSTDEASVLDRWTGIPWRFTPDSIGAEQLSAVSAALADYPR